ncbi:TrkA family potassium uptake protein [Pelagibius sp. Alg239-R121]|uniref:potassium channel family protein n=1 Tax=Pelagibius sp. Alg239-R121 TaxID=2993448 RepID=UPI0024A70B1F|nr:potassium channel family protein [Pelagibius sp. Alg239-R121]
MAKAPKSSRVNFIILRYMRRPILVLITVYATSMVGWILIPGIDENGNAVHQSFFHAFYFLTYTVTTTGFGELPYPFTEAQRMWGIVSLYIGVIAWFYALGSIVGLVQNADFKRSLAERQFAKRVTRISDPFCIVCGFGNTGALLVRGLSDAGMTVTVVDWKDERIKTVSLRDYRSDVSGLCADARVPEHLIEAGLLKPNCKAVVALTQNEEINLKISVTARLLNPEVWVATQSTSSIHEDTLATLGDKVHIIDPFQTYAKYLGAVIANPAIHSLNQWLAGTPDATLDKVLRPPKGNWVLCGFGRMGHWLREALEAQGITTSVVEPNPLPDDEDLPNLIVGRASQDNLVKAGVRNAAGIVAGTNNDSDNLSILLNARALNPDIFFVVRENRYRNLVVFEAAKVDLIMMPGLVSARRILFLLIAPMMKTFFETLRQRDTEQDGRFIDEVVDHLGSVVGGTQPRIWTLDTLDADIHDHDRTGFQVGGKRGNALQRLTDAGRKVTLEHLMGDPGDRSRRLACVPLVIESECGAQVLPDLSTAVLPGDRLLLCGDARAYNLIDATMHNEYTLAYLMTGKDLPRGWFMRWLFTKRIFTNASEIKTTEA